MKITKADIINIILEEMEADKDLLDAIKKLSSKIEDLDVSIDYLSAAVTGEDALGIGASQRALGRAASPARLAAREPQLEEKTLPDKEDTGGVN